MKRILISSLIGLYMGALSAFLLWAGGCNFIRGVDLGVSTTAIVVATHLGAIFAYSCPLWNDK